MDRSLVFDLIFIVFVFSYGIFYFTWLALHVHESPEENLDRQIKWRRWWRRGKEDKLSCVKKRTTSARIALVVTRITIVATASLALFITAITFVWNDRLFSDLRWLQIMWCTAMWFLLVITVVMYFDINHTLRIFKQYLAEQASD